MFDVAQEMGGGQPDHTTGLVPFKHSGAFCYFLFMFRFFSPNGHLEIQFQSEVHMIPEEAGAQNSSTRRRYSGQPIPD